MALVDYSDSEASETEVVPTNKSVSTTAPTKSAPTSSKLKPTFQKAVDRSNPHKIILNLPQISAPSADNEINNDAPPAKKARTGTGTFSGFSAFLPAPKRSGQSTTRHNTRKGGAKGGALGSGISLKTGATPSFSREAADDVVEHFGTQESTQSRNEEEKPTGTSDEFVGGKEPLRESADTEVKLVGKPIMFKPLSVARKPQKRTSKIKPPDSTTIKPGEGNTSDLQASTPAAKLGAKPKVSLFSLPHDEEPPSIPSKEENRTGHTRADDYEGLPPSDEVDTQPHLAVNPSKSDSSTATFAQPSQTLDSIAADLNLSESARRQIFGRRRGKDNLENMSSIKIVNFNTDKEYEANEALRAEGEIVQHNAVRAIAPGKHTLRQLVNAATTQADALEEAFASGRRNKKEAGSKYGW